MSVILDLRLKTLLTLIYTGRKGLGWSGIWRVYIISRYSMILRPYHLIFMGWSGRRAGIMKWSGKFLIYVGIFYFLCRGIRDILYIDLCELILVIILVIILLHYHHHVVKYSSHYSSYYFTLLSLLLSLHFIKS